MIGLELETGHHQWLRETVTDNFSLWHLRFGDSQNFDRYGFNILKCLKWLGRDFGLDIINDFISWDHYIYRQLLFVSFLDNDRYGSNCPDWLKWSGWEDGHHQWLLQTFADNLYMCHFKIWLLWEFWQVWIQLTGLPEVIRLGSDIIKDFKRPLQIAFINGILWFRDFLNQSRYGSNCPEWLKWSGWGVGHH